GGRGAVTGRPAEACDARCCAVVVYAAPPTWPHAPLPYPPPFRSPPSCWVSRHFEFPIGANLANEGWAGEGRRRALMGAWCLRRRPHLARRLAPRAPISAHSPIILGLAALRISNRGEPSK